MENKKIYYYGKAVCLCEELGVDIVCLDQVQVLATILENEGEEAAENVILLGELLVCLSMLGKEE